MKILLASITQAVSAACAMAAVVLQMAAPPPAVEELAALDVAPENRCAAYHAHVDYRYSRALERMAASLLGGYFGAYEDHWFNDDGSQTDIEHVVARSEAHDSGLCRASSLIKTAFSNDLDNVALASPAVNRFQKRDKDAAEWLPEHNRCWFAATVVKVKRKYGLAVDEAEAAALADVLAGCPSTDMEVSRR